MPSKSPQGALIDILENIDLARSFVAGLAFEDFQSDRRTVYAVVRCLEIISEASRKLPADLKARHSGIRWSSMASAGNAFRHTYGQIDGPIIWRTVNDSLEPLRVVISEELDRLKK